MVEVSLSFFTTISTIIVVTMATLFFCCWRKKGEGQITDGKARKESLKQESPQKESPPAHAAGRPENGVIKDRHGSPACVDTGDNDDDDDHLGDFSAVQRETEILRSYRKPPPPKNRARQSRAPRTFKSSTENLDIFTELNEEDNKENVNSMDETESDLLRPHSDDKDATSRECRSSMLADIEQTLAALHMSGQEQNPSREGSPVKVSTGPNQLAHAGRGDAEKGQTVDISKNVTLSGDSGQGFQELTVSVESIPSPKSSPETKPKRGPKVSPKPSPRITEKFKGGVDLSTANENLNVPTNSYESDLSTTASSLNFKSDNNASASTPLELLNSEKITAFASKIVSEITAEVIKSKNSFEASKDQATADSPSNDSTITQSSQEETVNTEVKNTTVKVSGTNKDSVEGPIKSTEHDDEGACQSESRLTTSLTNSQGGEVAASEVAVPTSKSESPSPPTPSKVKSNDGHSNTSSPSEPSSPPPQVNGTSRGRSDEPRKQRRESTDDQTGKSKTSKIPVRAGSKPRCSPPEGQNNEKAASPPK